MKWILGWPFLLLSLFLPEPYREQSLALQTIICTFFKCRQYTFQLLTFIFVLSYFVETKLHKILSVQILHHVIIACTVVVQYIEPQYQYFCWCLVGWSTRWLGSVNMYVQPIRTFFKCCVLLIVLKGKWRLSRKCEWKDELRWCWILFVHELMCILLPVQILYEVYSRKEQVLHI